MGEPVHTFGMTCVFPLLVVTAKGALAWRSSMISGGNNRSASIMQRSSTSIGAHQVSMQCCYNVVASRSPPLEMPAYKIFAQERQKQANPSTDIYLPSLTTALDTRGPTEFQHAHM